MAERNLGEPLHGINVASPDNIVQTARKGAVETAGYGKAELAKMPVPKDGDKDLHVKNDFNIDARNMTETLRGNHTQTVTGSETRTVTGAATQTTTGPVQNHNNGGATNITKEYNNSVVLGPNNSLNVGGQNNLTIGELVAIVMGVMETVWVEWNATHGFERKIAGVVNSHHGVLTELNGAKIVYANTSSKTTGTSSNNIMVASTTTGVNMAKHGTNIARSDFNYNAARYHIFDEA